MPQFAFRGNVKLNGATFYIEAPNEEEAIEKARLHQWDDYQTTGAEAIDWEINPNTCEAND